MISFLFSSFAFAAQLTLEESLALVEHGNIEVQIARLQSENAQLAMFASLANLLPTIEGNASWIDFDSPLEVNLLGDSSEDIDCSSFEAFGFGDLCSSFSEPMLLREERIFDGSIQALYPLSALYSIVQGYQASKLMAEISTLEVQATQKRIQLSVIELYMEALHLQQVIQFAEETEKRLSHHRDNVQAFVNQGLLNPIELQRLENAILETEIGAAEASSGYRLLCQQLELLLGVPVEPISFTKQLTLGQRVAVSDHPDIRIAQLQAQAATAAAKAAYGQLIPNIVVMTAKTRAIGQGTLTPTEQQYIGLALSGNFNWGSRYLQAKQSSKEAEMAEQAVILQERALVLQQQGAYDAWQMAQKRLNAAHSKAEMTEEIRRQASSKHSQQMLTTAELLDAEAEHLQAQLAIAAAESKVIILQARYQQTIDRQPFRFE